METAMEHVDELKHLQLWTSVGADLPTPVETRTRIKAPALFEPYRNIFADDPKNSFTDAGLENLNGLTNSKP